MRDRDFIRRLIDRAKAAKCSALVLTLDLQVLGQRHKDIKNGLSAPPKLTLANILNIEVHIDGGIRSGQDVIKALALDAKGAYIGRAFLYGLGAMGETGVTKCLEIIHKELDLTMAFCGVSDVKKVDKSILLPGTC